MLPQRALRWLLRVAILAVALFALIVLAIVVTWMARGGVEGGLVAAGRLLRYGPTTVDDFRHYPARNLRPSVAPAPFAVAPASPLPTGLTAPNGATRPFEEILRDTGTLTLLVVKADRLVYEWHGANREPAAPSQYFSVTKSIFATLVGMAIDDELIHSVEQPVTDFIPELAAHGFNRVSLRQLLDMTSPLDYEENDNPLGLHVLMNYTSRLEAMILDFRLREAETAFRYKSGDTALLSLALARAVSPLTLSEYAQRQLWTPLGMEDGALWTLDRDGGLEKAWCCLAGSARDLAKVGRLYLSRGRAGERQILSGRWIDGSAPPPDPGGKRDYALGWWPAGRDGSAFLAAGKDGQYLFVAPAQQAIVVRLGERHGYAAMSGWTALFGALAAHDWAPR